MAQLKINIANPAPAEPTRTIARLEVNDQLIDLKAELTALEPSFAGHPQQQLTIDPTGRFTLLEAEPAVIINGDRVANTILADGDYMHLGPFTIWFYEGAGKRKASEFAITELLSQYSNDHPLSGLTFTTDKPSQLSRGDQTSEDGQNSPKKSADALWQTITATLPCQSALWLRFGHQFGHKISDKAGSEKPEVAMAHGSSDELRSYPFGETLTIHRDLLSESLHRGTTISHTAPSGEVITARPITHSKNFYGWLLSSACPNEAPLELAAELLAQYSHNDELSRQIPSHFTRILSVLVSMLEAKDTYTAGHSKRVGEMARDFGRFLGLGPDTISQLANCGALHDIGKIAIPDNILKKPEPLTPEEFAEMKLHPVIGASILWRLPGSRSICPGVRHHHEKWNGSGYPDGLKGDQIPFFARIVSIIDSFDALVSGRTYSGFVPHDKALAILSKDSQLYDPKLLTAFIAFRKAATLSKGTDSASRQPLD